MTRARAHAAKLNGRSPLRVTVSPSATSMVAPPSPAPAGEAPRVSDENVRR
jgi:hypothetical protein